MPTTKVRNDVANDILLIGMQTAPGVEAVPTFLMDGKPDIDWLPETTFEDEANGTYMTQTSPTQGLPANTGAWGEVAMSYERIASQLRLICKAGRTPFSGSGPDYLYKQALDIIGDDAEYATGYYGTKGLLEKYTDLRYSELNLAWDPDGGGSWKATPTVMIGKGSIPLALDTVVASATTTAITVAGPLTASALVGGYVFLGGDTNLAGARLISANTTTVITVDTPYGVAPSAGAVVRVGWVPPAGITPITQTRIKAAGTKVYLDPSTGTIGTTPIIGRVISGNVSLNLNLDNKAFSENEFDRSGIYGRGTVMVTGQLVIEADKADEIRQLLNMTNLKMRIERKGPEIAPGVPMLFQIDVPKLVWLKPTRGTRNNNKTRTLTWQAISPTLPIEFQTRTTLAQLPN